MKWASLSLRFWALTLSALGACVGTFALGHWQLSRAAQKEAIAVHIHQQSGLPALPASALFSTDGAVDLQTLIHRSVQLQGYWLVDATVYLDNRQMGARPGFYVMTPLQLADSPGVVLVQRGWVPRNFMDRARVPTFVTEQGLIKITGRIAPSPAQLLNMGGEDTGVIRQNLELGAFALESGLALSSVMAVQIDADAGGLSRQWPAISTGVEKHYGYAFQWFALSVLIVVLYVWFQFFRRSRPFNAA